jgi:hypothetical protein
MIEENKNKIEDIKRNLYDPNDKFIGHQREGILHPIKHKVSEEWSDNMLKEEGGINSKFIKPPMSVFKKFFIVSVIFFIGALGFAYYKFSQNDVSVSSDKIDITVVGNSFTKGGDELPLQIEITNNNGASLELADLMVEYPRGAEDNATDVIRLPRDSIGTIKSGESVIRDIKVKLFGEEKSIRNIKISLEYHPEGSNAIFSKDKFYPVTISLAPLSLNIEAPISANSNQQISFSITAILNTVLEGENPILQVVYPSNFVFDGATPSPLLGNSTWDISSLSTTNPITIQIKGRLVGQDGDEQVFHVYAGETNGTDRSTVSVVYSSILQKISIAKPFLDARILVNNQDKTEYIVSGGETINAEIDWTNNLTTRITDGQIIVSLSGNAFDESTVNANSGFYDSMNDQIIWDRNSIDRLAEINPGEKGTVSFSLKPRSLVGVSNLLKDPKISLKVSIKGREPLQGSTYNDINNFSEKIVKVSTDFQIASSAHYLSGSLPPKAETETNYIITWTLSNSANGISQAQARSAIPIYVKWVGLASGQNDNLIYNDVTREIIWNIGTVLPGVGINSNREISFIISLTPSLSQVDSIPQLMKEVNLSGIDTFTNALIKSAHTAITTLLINDPNSALISPRVVQ